MKQKNALIEGACHCGRVRWSLGRMPKSAIACSCNLCRRYAALWAYDYEDEGGHVTGETQAWAWGFQDITYHFCGVCGCVTHFRAVERNDEGRRRIGVNLRLADPEQVGQLAVRRVKTRKRRPSDGRLVADFLDLSRPHRAGI